MLFFIFIPSLFSFSGCCCCCSSAEQVLFCVCVCVLSARYIDTWLPPSNLLTTSPPPKENFSLPISFRWTKRKKERKKKNNLMSELIKACRSCICCPVYVSGFAGWPLSFLSYFRRNKNKMCRTSNFFCLTPCPQKSAYIQVAGLESNTQHKKKIGKALKKNWNKMKRKCLISLADVILSTAADLNFSMNNSGNLIYFHFFQEVAMHPSNQPSTTKHSLITRILKERNIRFCGNDNSSHRVRWMRMALQVECSIKRKSSQIK